MNNLTDKLMSLVTGLTGVISTILALGVVLFISTQIFKAGFKKGLVGVFFVIAILSYLAKNPSEIVSVGEWMAELVR